jgi:threonyl-tRNA synthetase
MITKLLEDQNIACEDYFIENQSVEYTIKRAYRHDFSYVILVGSFNEKIGTVNLEVLHSEGKQSMFMLNMST